MRDVAESLSLPGASGLDGRLSVASYRLWILPVCPALTAGQLFVGSRSASPALRRELPISYYRDCLA